MRFHYVMNGLAGWSRTSIRRVTAVFPNPRTTSIIGGLCGNYPKSVYIFSFHYSIVSTLHVVFLLFLLIPLLGVFLSFQSPLLVGKWGVEPHLVKSQSTVQTVTLLTVLFIGGSKRLYPIRLYI